MEVQKVHKCLFENEEKKELVYAWYEDLDGYIIYEKCTDPLQTKRKLTKQQFFNRFRRIW